jgi:hypothetical protein
VGQIVAAYSSPASITGRYLPAAGSGLRGGYVALRPSLGQLPAPFAVTPQATLRPRFSLFLGRSCTLQRVVPTVEGEPAAGVAALNGQLAAFFAAPPGDQDGILCDERTLSPATSRLFLDIKDFHAEPLAPGLFALAIDAYQDSNGAHGNSVRHCHAADLATGRLVELNTLIDGDRGREGITHLVEAVFRRENKVTDLTKAGFFSNAAPVRKDTNLCVEDGKLQILFEPYEVGPHSFGRPAAALDPVSVKGYLVADPITTALLGALAARLARGLRGRGGHVNVQVNAVKNPSRWSSPRPETAMVPVLSGHSPDHPPGATMRLSFLASSSLIFALCAAACSSSSDNTATPAATGGSGDGGSAAAGAGGSSDAGSGGTAGSGTAGSGTAGSGTAGSGTAGSGTAGSGTAGAPSAEADKACTDLVKARCARTDACTKDGTTLKYGSEADCEAREKIGCLAGLAAPDTSSNPAYVEGCATSLAAQSCDDFLNGNAACVPAPGPRKNGDPCSAAAQCDSTFCAIVKTTQCGTCAPLPKAGDSCATTSCGRDLKCDNGSMLCYVPGAAGATCSKDVPCGNGLSCVGPKGGPTTCVAEVSKAGDPCDFKKQMAADCNRDAGLFCDNNNVCAALTEGKVGDACGFDKTTNTSVICTGGASCLAPMMGAKKVCTAPAADGAACDSASGPFCQTPARCVATASGSTAGTCQLPDPAACK